jgi:hypothetical protein
VCSAWLRGSLGYKRIETPAGISCATDAIFVARSFAAPTRFEAATFKHGATFVCAEFSCGATFYRVNFGHQPVDFRDPAFSVQPPVAAIRGSSHRSSAEAEWPIRPIFQLGTNSWHHYRQPASETPITWRNSSGAGG